MSGGETLEKRRLGAIMFTDIVGYTGLAQANEARALKLLEEQRGLVRPLLARYEGREVKTIGDAFLVEFGSALKATECAAEIQKVMFERNSKISPDTQVKVRVGIHVGEVVRDGTDVLGDAVNVASRIGPLADPGGICFTQQVYDHVRNKSDLRIARLGPIALKNVREPVEIYKIVPTWEGRMPAMAEVARNRVAVLPFANISAVQADEYIADGLTEELISTMSKVRELSIISRTSVMQYKNKGKPISEIGRELNAGTILEGSVRKAGNRLRVSIQMIDAMEDKHVWAENYDRDVQDIFAVQSDIAEKVAEALKVELLAQEKEEMKEVPTKSPEAHTLFLKGMFHTNKGAPRDIEKGIEYLKLGVDQDPDFALCHAWLALNYIFIADESMPGSVAFPRAKESLARALALNNRLSEAHVALALIAYQYDWDWAFAESEFKRSIELNPNLAFARDWYARFLGTMGRFDEAMAGMNRALELDPLSLRVLMRFGTVCWMARRYDEAREKWMKVLKLQPKYARAYAFLGLLNALEGKSDEAVREAETAVGISGEAYFREFEAMVYAIMGAKGKSLDILQGLLSKKYGSFFSSVGIGNIYYLLGEKDKGFEWMEKAYAERAAALPFTNHWPILDKAREDPRFMDLLRNLKLV